MILKGNQRGGARQLARHLLNGEDNEHVHVHDLRGFVAADLAGALQEAYGLSRGTRARQFLFSLSLSPPPHAQVPTEDFEAAIGTIEAKLGLANQPRAIVFHEKAGRRHTHAVWSRIDAERMTAIHLPYYKRRLSDIAKALYLEHGWDLPPGFAGAKGPDPLSYTQAEAQQAQRAGYDPKELKRQFQEWWVAAANGPAFAQAIQAGGFCLARGDRRGFVVVDGQGEVYALSKLLGLRAREVAAKLGSPEHLPTVAQAGQALAKGLAAKPVEPPSTDAAAASRSAQRVALVIQRRELVLRQRAERAALERVQAERWAREALARAQRFRTGLRAVWDRITGKHACTTREAELETASAMRRDRDEMDRLIFAQLNERISLERHGGGTQQTHGPFGSVCTAASPSLTAMASVPAPSEVLSQRSAPPGGGRW